MKKFNFLFKKSILIIIVFLMFTTFIINNFLNYSLENKKNYILKINQEKIYPNSLSLSYIIENKKNQINNKNKIQKIQKKILFQIIKHVLFKKFIKNIVISTNTLKPKKYIKNIEYFQKKKNLI